jgi:hypothetical protein
LGQPRHAVSETQPCGDRQRPTRLPGRCHEGRCRTSRLLPRPASGLWSEEPRRRDATAPSVRRRPKSRPRSADSPGRDSPSQPAVKPLSSFALHGRLLRRGRGGAVVASRGGAVVEGKRRQRLICRRGVASAALSVRIGPIAPLGGRGADLQRFGARVAAGRTVCIHRLQCVRVQQ